MATERTPVSHGSTRATRGGEYRTARLVLAAWDEQEARPAGPMIAPEDPPGFVVRTEAQKAAWDNGFRLERGAEKGGWLSYGSTTARGEIWIAGVPPRSPWLLSVDHPGMAAELAALPPSPLSGPGLATFVFDTLTALHAALDRVYKLGVSLPDAPLARFRARTAGLNQTTEAERLDIQRIGQDIFRAALMDYSGGRCRSPASPILRCFEPPTSSPGPNATTPDGSMCTTACSSPRFGMRPSTWASSASPMTEPCSLAPN